MSTLAVEGTSIQRIGEVPIYQADPIVRRAESLQRTRDAAEPVAWMPAHLMDKLGIGPGQSVRVKQGEGEAQLARGAGRQASGRMCARRRGASI